MLQGRHVEQHPSRHFVVCTYACILVMRSGNPDSIRSHCTIFDPADHAELLFQGQNKYSIITAKQQPDFFVHSNGATSFVPFPHVLNSQRWQLSLTEKELGTFRHTSHARQNRERPVIGGIRYSLRRRCGSFRGSPHTLGQVPKAAGAFARAFRGDRFQRLQGGPGSQTRPHQDTSTSTVALPGPAAARSGVAAALSTPETPASECFKSQEKKGDSSCGHQALRLGLSLQQ